MFCQGCGKQVTQGEACPCGFTPVSQPAESQQSSAFSANDLVKVATTRFSINQLIVLGGCLLLLIFLFMPFQTISLLGMSGSVSGYRVIFGGRDISGSFGYFLMLLLPIIVIATLSFIKLAKSKELILIFAFMGVYMSFATIFLVSVGISSAGVGLIFSFLVWLAVAAAAYMEYKGINLFHKSA